jgi:galactose mutarotase-like enzyme
MDYYSPQNSGCRIRQFAHRGHELLSMENSLVRIILLLDKGGDIIEFIYKPKDLDFLWKQKDGLTETAKLISPASQVSGAYFDYYPGGWQEILPGGGPMNYLGAEVGLHGEISLRPWQFRVEEDTPEQISVLLTAKTLRFPFAVKKRIIIKKDCPAVSFEEELRNEGRQPLEYMWAQHPCFGPPFLEPGCVISIPAKKMMTSPGFHTSSMIFEGGFTADWPYSGERGEKIVNVQEENSRITGFYHFSEMEEGKMSIYNKNKKIGFSLEWETSVFPYVTSWQDYNGCMDYPWYGNGYNATLEFWNTPTDNFETAKKIAPIPKLEPEKTVATSFSAVILI